MTAVLDRPQPPRIGSTALAATDRADGLLRRPVWKRFTPLQLIVMAMASIAPVVIAGSVVLAVLGFVSIEAMTSVALGAGENPGIITFGAMFMATPVQSFTGRSQVRVRKYLGIVFFLLALSNGAMFVVETGIGASLGSPFLIAGSVALLVSAPLFLTSSRWSQRAMGMKRWRLLHKATYLVALALMTHVLLIPDIGPGFLLIASGFVLRIPAMRRWLENRGGKQLS